MTDPLDTVRESSQVRSRIMERERQMAALIDDLEAAIADMDAAPLIEREPMRGRVVLLAREVVAAAR